MRVFSKKELKSANTFVFGIYHDTFKNCVTFSDDFKEVLDEYKSRGADGYIGVFRKMIVWQNLDTDSLFESMLTDFEYVGCDPDWLEEQYFTEEDKKDFEKVIMRWFKKRVGDAWFAGEYLGRLDESISYGVEE